MFVCLKDAIMLSLYPLSNTCKKDFTESHFTGKSVRILELKKKSCDIPVSTLSKREAGLLNDRICHIWNGFIIILQFE